MSKNVRFRLVRYFTLASLGMFLVVTIALVYFERQQAAFFHEVQSEEIDFIKRVQASFAKQQDDAARHDLLAIHERANVDLTRLFANTLWEKDFAPFVTKIQAIRIAHCRAIADLTDKDGKKIPPDDKKACYQEVGAQIRALPEYKSLDAKVFAAMRTSSVFKVKVFDLRGITVYSSEPAQIGEDKNTNAGWKNAMQGKPNSELTHRDKFSTFEGVVENRDLISSYMPVHAPGSNHIIGVFEMYTDVTGFLDQIKKTSAKIVTTARDNENQMRELVENLRDFTRFDREKITHFDINKGLHTVVYIARSVIPHCVEVVEEYADVPVVECNPSQLNQVFLNLINNAAQVIPGEGKVTVRTSVEEFRVRIDITDTGSGIPADVQPYIFTRTSTS